MPADPISGESAGPDLEMELQAERAASEHWRRLARQRSADFDELRRRPSVRALLAAERRFGRLVEPVRNGVGRVRVLLDRTELGVTALGRRGQPLAALASTLSALPAAEVENRRTLLVVVGEADHHGLKDHLDTRVVEVATVRPSEHSAAAVRRAIDAGDHELVAVLLGSTEPVDPAWLARLAGALVGDVSAATPVAVHPRRPWDSATPHDGRVRTAGLAIEVGSDGVPIVMGIDAGTVPDPARPARVVDAASSACVVLDRVAYDEAGGLPPIDDLEVALVELCGRLRARGRQVVVVPSAIVVDHRPVRSRRDLQGPIDPAGPTWMAALERNGPALRRAARPRPADSLRFVLTVAAPSEKVAARWGDWHLAVGLASGLRRLGHEVQVQPLNRADGPAGRASDVHLVLRGLRPVRRTVGQRHVIWVISHPESIDDDELDAADLVLAASPRFADHLRTRTSTPIEVLLQGTDHHRFSPRPVDPSHRHPITIVAKTRDVLRPVVADALRVGLRPSIYGAGWRDLVDPSLIVADHVENEELPVVYSSAGVVLNDHWRTMQRWGFISNRLYDVLACGVPVISDPVAGLADVFDGAVLEYHTPADLRRLVDEVLADSVSARSRAERGRQAVLGRHTLDHRAEELIRALSRHGSIS